MTEETRSRTDTVLAGIINASKAIGSWLKSETRSEAIETYPDKIGFVFLL
jgi:hypothetical protein